MQWLISGLMFDEESTRLVFGTGFLLGLVMGLSVSALYLVYYALQ